MTNICPVCGGSGTGSLRGKCPICDGAGIITGNDKRETRLGNDKRETLNEKQAGTDAVPDLAFSVQRSALEAHPTAPPEVLYVLIKFLKARGIDMTRQREIARMAHGIDRDAALWLDSADERAYRTAVDEARQIAEE